MGAARRSTGGLEGQPPKKSDVPVGGETNWRRKLRGRGKRRFPRSGRPLETSAAENDGRRRRATLPLRGRRVAPRTGASFGPVELSPCFGNYEFRRPTIGGTVKVTGGNGFGDLFGKSMIFPPACRCTR